MKIAAIDLGSNSFHLVVAEAQPDGSFDVIAREKDVLRLGDAVAATGRIGKENGEYAVDTMRRMAATARSVDADEIVACATSAFREADDSVEICDAIFDETGISVDVISGKREAQLIFSAVRRSIAITKPPAVCLDLGGGSLEISVGDASGPAWSTSLHLGVGRLTTLFVKSDPPSTTELRQMHDHISKVLEPVLKTVSKYEPRMLIGTSGTLCDLASMAAAQRDGRTPSSVNQLTVCLRDLKASHEVLVATPSRERAKLSGLDPRRADQVPAGSMVLLTTMSALHIDELTVGDWALREGIILDAIERHDLADWSDDPEAVRQNSVLALARRCNFDEDHASTVARLATELFDQTSSLHQLEVQSRFLLEYAAILHDVGEHVAVDGHDKHTAYLIQNGRLKGFMPEEIDVLATLGRYHRRGSPGSSFEPWSRLDRENKDRALKLLGLLRLADGLDRGHAGVVDGVDLSIDEEAVHLSVRALGDADLEIWGIRKKKALFEQLFERHLEVLVTSSY